MRSTPHAAVKLKHWCGSQTIYAPEAAPMLEFVRILERNITAASPAVAITAPVGNATLGSTSTVNIVVTASVAPNTINKIEIFDGTTLLTTFNPAALNSITATYPWTGMSVGSHTLTAKVTDSQGTIITSAAVTVQVLGAPSISLSTLSSYTLAGSSIDLNASVTPAANTTIARVEFFANNGTTNQLIGTITAAPYNFRWTNVVAGSYSFTAKVTDSQTLTTTSAAVGVTVGTSITIQLAGGLNGSTVNDDAIYVSGTVSAPPNSAVNVNGQFATVTSSGQFFLNDLHLQPGANMVTATVTGPDGQTANQVITITRSAAIAPFVVTVAAGGIATATTPLNIDVKIENPGNTAFATITLQCDDPAAGTTLTAIGTYQCGYIVAGVYSVRVTVKDNMGGVIYAVVKMVTVKSPAEQHQTVRGVYDNMIERLRVGSIDLAVGSITTTQREQFRQYFTSLGAGLLAQVNALGTITTATLSEDFAYLTVVRTETDGQYGYRIYLVRDGDGIWRIDGM